MILNREVIEVFGFTEPGNEVWVDNIKTKVDDHGVFLMRCSGSSKDIEVKAKSTKGEVKVYRHFVVAE